MPGGELEEVLGVIKESFNIYLYDLDYSWDYIFVLIL